MAADIDAAQLGAVSSLVVAFQSHSHLAWPLALSIPAVSLRLLQWPLTVLSARGGATAAHAMVLARARAKNAQKRAGASGAPERPTVWSVERAARDLCRADATRHTPKDAAAYLKFVREDRETLKVAPWVAASRAAHPAWGIAAPLVAVPTFVAMAVGVRHVCRVAQDVGDDDGDGRAATIATLKRGGFWPFVDLTRAPYEYDRSTKTLTLPFGALGLVAPTAIFAASYAQVRVAAASSLRAGAESVWSKRMFVAMEWLSLAVFAAALHAPYGVLCYWGAASAAGLAQGVAFRGRGGQLLRERLTNSLPSASLANIAEARKNAPSLQEARAAADAELKRRTEAAKAKATKATVAGTKGQRRGLSASAAATPPRAPSDAELDPLPMRAFKLFFTVALFAGFATLAPGSLTEYARFGHAVAMLRKPSDEFLVATALGRIGKAADWDARGISANADVMRALDETSGNAAVAPHLRTRARELAQRIRREAAEKDVR